MFRYKITLTIFFIFQFNTVDPHGRLISPASRSTAWRYGYPTTVNYDDNQLFCGGQNVQWQRNGGKCGICGDPWHKARENEYPNGKYTKPKLFITGSYESGSIIKTMVEITTAHLGYFTFKLCPVTSINKEVTQECLDKHLLKIPRPLYSIKRGFSDRFDFGPKRSGNYSVPVKLPNNLKCERCVIQWTYTTGNTWGRCSNGTFEEGCGPQETFLGCADIRINPKGAFYQFRPYNLKSSV